MDEDLGSKASILTTEYGVMKTVLSQLPIKQLNKAATVCKAWNETSKIIKKTRNEIYAFGVIQEGKEVKNYENLEKFFEIIKSEPQLCLTFLIGNCEDHAVEQTTTEALLKQLPKTCPLVGGMSHGVVFSNTNLEPKEVESGNGFGILLVPDLGDITIKKFHLNRESMKKLGKAIVSQTEDVGHLLSMEQSDEVQCLVLLGLDPGREARYLEAICRYFQERNQKVAIGGGFMETLLYPQIEKDQYSAIAGLAFCGSRVRATSIVVPENVNNASEVEKMVLRLKEGHESGKRSIGFMFACVARGANFYGETGVESSIFRKLFPNTPLVGFFGNGEIGVNNLDQHRNVIPSGPKKSRATYLYSYSTTFVLLSFLD